MKRVSVSWQAGETSLFLLFNRGEPEILDYEFDTGRLHEMCGGKHYYRSRSGMSGAGYFNSLGPLVPVGYYRIDTVHNDWQCFTAVGEWREHDIFVAVPYCSHKEDKSEALRSHPTVVKVDEKIIYVNFYENLSEILRLLLSGENLPEECVINGFTYDRRGHRTLRRSFVQLNCWAKAQEEEVIMEYYNLCSMYEVPSPWEFFRGELQEYENDGLEERLFRLLSVERLKDGTFVKTVTINGQSYRGRILPGNPLETDDLTAGWQRLAGDAIIRFYDEDNKAHLVVYVKADEAYSKQAKRLAARLGEGEEFISFVSAHDEWDEYVEYEVVVPKVLYLLDPATQLAEARKGLARKIREDVMYRARARLDDKANQAVLGTIPDDLVVTISDSLDAGNCRPGTEAFIAQYFPGQTQTTAGELKKYAANRDVMRIFRHLAATRV